MRKQFSFSIHRVFIAEAARVLYPKKGGEKGGFIEIVAFGDGEIP